ncbi:putative bifunctional DNA primase/polymerase [Streptomyces sp. Tu6071]|nr:putative bifunctional DNA primase/polymerase [Streptomyces sp. Tu6071]
MGGALAAEAGGWGDDPGALGEGGEAQDLGGPAEPADQIARLRRAPRQDEEAHPAVRGPGDRARRHAHALHPGQREEAGRLRHLDRVEGAARGQQDRRGRPLRPQLAGHRRAAGRLRRPVLVRRVRPGGRAVARAARAALHALGRLQPDAGDDVPVPVLGVPHRGIGQRLTALLRGDLACSGHTEGLFHAQHNSRRVPGLRGGSDPARRAARGEGHRPGVRGARGHRRGRAGAAGAGGGYPGGSGFPEPRGTNSAPGIGGLRRGVRKGGEKETECRRTHRPHARRRPAPASGRADRRAERQPGGQGRTRRGPTPHGPQVRVRPARTPGTGPPGTAPSRARLRTTRGEAPHGAAPHEARRGAARTRTRTRHAPVRSAAPPHPHHRPRTGRPTAPRTSAPPTPPTPCTPHRPPPPEPPRSPSPRHPPRTPTPRTPPHQAPRPAPTRPRTALTTRATRREGRSNTG